MLCPVLCPASCLGLRLQTFDSLIKMKGLLHKLGLRSRRQWMVVVHLGLGMITPPVRWVVRRSPAGCLLQPGKDEKTHRDLGWCWCRMGMYTGYVLDNKAIHTFTSGTITPTFHHCSSASMKFRNFCSPSLKRSTSPENNSQFGDLGPNLIPYCIFLFDIKI